MKAICVTSTRNLEVREISIPSAPPINYINVRIAASSINNGDKAFLKIPALIASLGNTQKENVWGASASGIITELGSNVSSSFIGRKVAIFRGLKPNDKVLELWCEMAQVPFETCLLLPDHINVKDYSGSLVNIVTAYGFLDQIVAEGHTGVIVTAGNSGTGRALTILAKRRGIPILLIVRSPKSKQKAFNNELKVTAVFDGVGGSLITKMLSILPPNSAIYFYGFLSGVEKIEFNSTVFMKGISMTMFRSGSSATVKERLASMLKDLEGYVDDPMFRSTLGNEFQPEEIDAAMKYEGGSKKAVIVFP